MTEGGAKIYESLLLLNFQAVKQRNKFFKNSVKLVKAFKIENANYPVIFL